MTGISTLGAALDQIERIKDQQSLFSSLSSQMTTGKKTQSFTGLGIDALVSKRARADFKSVDSYISNIDNANRRISLTANAVNQFKAQAKLFSDALKGISQESTHQKGDIIYYDDPLTPEVENVQVGQTSGVSDADMKNLQDLAGKIFSTLTELMNQKEGDRYLFGGADSSTKPFNANGNLDASISNLIAGWKSGTITNDDLVADFKDGKASSANPNALNDTTIGFSASLSAGNAGNVFVRVSQTSEIDYTALANDPAFRDIIAAAAYFKNPNLTPVANVYASAADYPGVPDTAGAPGATLGAMKENFYKVFNQMTGMVTEALKDIDSVSYKLAGAQARIQQIKLDHVEEKNLLKSAIDDIENADTNEVAIKLTTLQTQLQASFQITSITQQLTLANYLGF